MANRKADEGLDRRPEEASDDAPLAPGNRGEPAVRGVPPVIPAGAAANMSVDSTSASAGGQTGPQGTPAAAAILAGEIAFGQDDVKTGSRVIAADDVAIGTVVEVGPERILVDRTDTAGQIYIPYTGIRSLDNRQVHLGVPSSLVDRQDWQQVLPGRQGRGPSPPSGVASSGQAPSMVPSVGSESGGSGQTQAATSHGAAPQHAEPVTTGHGVEVGPTEHTVRAGPLDPIPTAAGAQAERPTEAASPPRQSQFVVEREPMQEAQNMVGNIKHTVQNAAQGQMDTGAPKEAFAEMFSFLENIPNTFYYLATVVSVFTSLVLFITGKRWESLFVGLWAPTIVSASMFYKLLRPSHEVRQI